MRNAAVVNADDSAITCTACLGVADLFKDILGNNPNTDCLVYIVTQVCTRLHIEDSTVCQMIVGLYKEQTIYIVEQLVHSPKELCGLLLYVVSLSGGIQVVQSHLQLHGHCNELGCATSRQ